MTYPSWWPMGQTGWYGFKFVVELFLALGIFTHFLKKRNYFWLRILASAAALIGIAFLFSVKGDTFISFTMIAFYISVLFLLIFCFDISFSEALFCWILACSIQFVVSQSYAFFSFWVKFPYLDLIEFLVMIVVYLLSYFFLAKKIKNEGIAKLNNIKITLIGSLVWIVVDLFCNVGRSYGWETPMSAVYGIICSGLVVVIVLNLLRSSQVEEEEEHIKALLKQEESQHRITQEAIEYIEIRNHDLKYQLQYAKNGGDAKNLTKIEDSIQDYEDIVKTECSTLNVVLTEKIVLSRKSKAKIYYVVDGKALSFIDPQDIYSLFSNLLDNAMEAVNKEDETHRDVNLNVFVKNSMLIISVFNYCSKAPSFNGEFPVTTKNDKNEHGYGTKSISYLARKYNGNATFSYKNNIFTVSVLIPIKNS